MSSEKAEDRGAPSGRSSAAAASAPTAAVVSAATAVVEPAGIPQLSQKEWETQFKRCGWSGVLRFRITVVISLHLIFN